MTTPAGGPSVPPPPGGSFGNTQPPSGQFGQTQPPSGPAYGAPGQPGQPGGYGGPGGPAGPGGPGQPYGGGPGGQPPKKGMGKGVIAAIVGVVALVLLACGIGGFFIANRDDDDPTSSSTTTSETSTESTTESTTETSEPTSETTTESTTETSEPTSETSSSSSAAAGSLPEEFDGWKRGTTSSSGGQETAVYRKGSDTISVVIGEGVKPADFEAIWDNPKKVGDHNCGELSSTTQCAGETGGTTYLITSASGSSASEVSKILDEFLKAV